MSTMDHKSDGKMYVVDPELAKYATTDRQRQFIEMANKHGSLSAADRAMNVSAGLTARAIRNLKKQAAIKGYAPEAAMGRMAPDPLIVKGVSTMDRIGPNGERTPIIQWTKTKIDDQLRLQAILEVIESQAADLPRIKPVARPVNSHADLCNVYTFTDCHIGMLAWGKESGEDWDLEIAEETLTRAFQLMIENSPAAETCVIAQLGDWMHYDGLVPVTPTAGHILDADSRFQKMLEVAVRVLRRIVQWALERHDKVILLCAEGNHDMAMSAAFRTFFNIMYENEPRVDVITDPLPYYAYQHGDVMLGWHHGHLKKPESAPATFAAYFRRMWGACDHVYIHLGDKHHLDQKDFAGCRVIQHSTIASKDAYAARHGWDSVREARVFTYHKDFGQVFSNTVTPKMIEAANA